MAASGPPPSCGRCCFVLFLLLSLAAVRGDGVAGEGRPLGANCGSIDPCRAGVANDLCCRAINAAIGQGTCSCACRQLATYGQARLAAACSGKSGCPKCRDCRCSQYLAAPYLSAL